MTVPQALHQICLSRVILPLRTQAAGPASLVADLTDRPDVTAGLDPRWLTAVGDRLFFSGWEPLTGRELWTSDGTADGTRRVADACPGDCSAVDGPFVPLDGAIYFEACDAASTCSLWRSDGSAEGTGPVTDFHRPGSGVRQLLEWNGDLYFEACDIPHGCEVFRSDGQPGGEVLLADTVPGPTDGGILYLTVANGSLHWAAADGRELWTSDGTVGGSRIVRDLSPSRVAPTNNAIAGNGTHIFFVVGYNLLWISDGTTSGTREILLRNDRIQPLATVGDRLYFVTSKTLWFSNGTTILSRPVRDLPAAPDLSLGFRGEIYLAIGSELWKSNGTIEGTVLLEDLEARITGAEVTGDVLSVSTQSALWEVDETGTARKTASLPASWPTPFQSGVAFSARDANGGSELALWTGLETALLTDVVDPGSSHPGHLTAIGNTLFLVLTKPYSFEPYDLYRVQEGTSEVRFLGSFTRLPAVRSVGGKVFVLAEDVYVIEQELTTIADLPAEDSGVLGLLPDSGLAVGNRLVFLVWQLQAFEPPEVELWISDGTVAGTHRANGLVDFTTCSICDPPPSEPPVYTYGLTVVGDLLFAHFEDHLFVKDGLESQAVELPIDCIHCDVDELAAVGSLLFFTTSSDRNGLRRLWVSDGTEAGTVVLLDLEPVGDRPVRLGDLVALGDRLVFTLEDPEIGEELWGSDGTAAGTLPLVDLRPGAASSGPRHLTVFSERLVFSADDGVHGRELWTTDGSPEGTRLVADLRPGAASSEPSELTAVDGRLLFSADDGVSGRELWVSHDGLLDAGRLQDLEPGPLPSSPAAFTATGGRIYFTAGTTNDGFELWSMARAESTVGDLLDGRFAVSVEWERDGETGMGHPIAVDGPPTGERLAFWFSSPATLELFVAIRDGRGLNDHFWLFYDARTDAAFRLRVEDRVTGAVRIYDGPSGDLRGFRDVRAFQ